MSSTPFPRAEKLCLSPIYLDSDVFIHGLIEIQPEIQSHHNFSRTNDINEINSANQILKNWNPNHLYISTFTLLETIKNATIKYELPLIQVLDLIIDGIGKDFTILFPELDILRNGKKEIAKRIEEAIPMPSKYSSECIRGEVFTIDGQSLGTGETHLTTYSGCKVASSRFGPSEFVEDRSVKIGKVREHRISSLKFERELFMRAAQIASDFSLSVTDAIHLVYCQDYTSGIAIFVTCDNRILNAFNTKQAGFPEARKPSQVIDNYKKFF